MSPYSLHILTHEVEDVLTESVNMISRYMYVIPTVILPFLGILFCLLKIKSSKSVLGTVILGAIFYCCYTRYYNGERPGLNTNELRFTIGNSIKAIIGYGILETHTFESSEYIPYEITDIYTGDDINEPITIVYIMGESCNYKHMSLFGYERETTPHLSELAKMENFYFTNGISSGVATFAASKFMLNAIREPDNIKQSAKNSTNLFKLAKQHGFKTFYLSSQTSHLLSSISGVNYIDVAVTRGLHFTDSRKLKDEHLFDLLAKQKFGKRNFIVLHQTCIHAPYTTTFSKNFTDRSRFTGSKNKLIDEYDNAMFYNDFLISKMFNTFNKEQNGKFYIIFASDHNEALGENGRFGHTQLFPEIANIPIIVQSNDLHFIDNIKQIFLPNHYEIAKSIIKILGYKFNNPNEHKNLFYICGVDPSGKCGYIPYVKNQQKRFVKYGKASD
ncbi:MAG: phosphoethanolamine transferase [Holosporales bacterium]|jgi:glucan phosphoethanolaminetransferase (alkaline phosphatase superfamily)|nr:phosphoethanolamine transferase [Holosporales bacterium]